MIIVEELKAAAAAIEEAEVAEDLRTVAFTAAFWAGHGATAPASTSPPTDPPAHQPGDSNSYERVAQKMGVSVDDAEFAFELQNKGKDLGLLIRPSALDGVRSHAQKQVVYLVTAARQAAGIETETAAGLLKGVCKELGKDDTNFASVLGGLHGEGLIISGPQRSRIVKVNADGFERAGKVLKELRQPSNS